MKLDRTLLGLSPQRSLTLRIVTLFLGLLLAVQGLSFVFTRQGIHANALQGLQGSLNLGEQVFRRLLQQDADHLSESTLLLASDFGFRSAVASNDAATLSSALANHGERMAAQVVMFIDTQARIKASTVAVSAPLQALAQTLVTPASPDHDSPPAKPVNARIHAWGEQPYQWVVVPVRAPLPIGWVVMGFSLQERLLIDMQQLSGIDVVLLVSGEAGQSAWRAPLSALSPIQTESLISQWTQMAVAPSQAMAGNEAFMLGDSEHAWRMVPLQHGAGPQVLALLTRSVDAALMPYERLQTSMLLLNLLAVIAFGLGSLLTARRVTRPVLDLTQMAERLRSGDLDTVVPAQGQDEIGRLAQAFEAMRQAVRTREQAIRSQAFVDGLTGLPNRAQFTSDVKHALQSRPPESTCAVLMLDLDRFKHVNDVLGHDAGDQLLRIVGQRLRGLLQEPTDTVARLNGDQFAMLLNRCTADEAPQFARDVLACLEQPLQLSGHTVDVSAGMGLAMCPQHAQDASTLVRRAEMAMHHAKQSQLGHVVFRPELDVKSELALSLLGELRQALDKQELRLYLQPKVCVRTGQVLGAEGLVRWEHPTRGLVPPMRFIPFAEQTGFIRQITGWLLNEAVITLQRWQDAGLELELAINLSARDLIDADLPERVRNLLQTHDVNPMHLCLEITESAIMDDPNRAQQTLEQFHDMGLRLAIDDFGTGYSSLAYLKRLPVDELKIDRSFVMNMQQDAQDAKIVRSVVDLAHNLGLQVIAEGVEGGGAWQLLSALRCDMAQGYGIAKPMPNADFLPWMQAWEPPIGTLPLPDWLRTTV